MSINVTSAMTFGGFASHCDIVEAAECGGVPVYTEADFADFADTPRASDRSRSLTYVTGGATHSGVRRATADVGVIAGRVTRYDVCGDMAGRAPVQVFWVVEELHESAE